MLNRLDLLPEELLRRIQSFNMISETTVRGNYEKVVADLEEAAIMQVDDLDNNVHVLEYRDSYKTLTVSQYLLNEIKKAKRYNLQYGDIQSGGCSCIERVSKLRQRFSGFSIRMCCQIINTLDFHGYEE